MQIYMLYIDIFSRYFFSGHKNQLAEQLLYTGLQKEKKRNFGFETKLLKSKVIFLPTGLYSAISKNCIF